MSLREEIVLNYKMDSFLNRKTHEHPEIIQLEKWVRYEYTPKKKYVAERRRRAKK